MEGKSTLSPSQGDAPEEADKSKVQLVKAAERPRKSPYPMVSVDEAIDIILKETSCLNAVWKNLDESFSSVLASNVIASEPHPSFPTSIKDGYAVKAEDRSKVKKVVGVVTPGKKLNVEVTFGSCVRVSTGSVIPDGANAVVQVEDTAVTEKDDMGNELKIEILTQPEVMQDIRAVGSDAGKGDIVIPIYKKIAAAEVGVLSMCGIREALVYEKPRVALLSTGDEIVASHLPVTPGCIRDSNKNSLKFMLVENRVPVFDAGIAKDNPDDIKAHLTTALQSSEVVITTGGVSMGERDILKEVLKTDFDATIHFGRVHMKPGKPTTFSTLTFKKRKKLVISLPGNPVSAFVCFYLFVLPCVKKMMGFSEPKHPTIKVKLGHNLKLDERPEFYRASLNCGADGVFIAQSTGSQQSSRLLSLQNADALLVLPPKNTEKQILIAGTLVDAILIKPF